MTAAGDARTPGLDGDIFFVTTNYIGTRGFLGEPVIDLARRGHVDRVALVLASATGSNIAPGRSWME